MGYSLTIHRLLSKRIDDNKIKEQVQYLVGRSLTGQTGRTWDCKIRRTEPYSHENEWLYEYKLNYKKVRGQQSIADSQFVEIRDKLSKAGMAARFTDSPWSIHGEDSTNVGGSADDVVKLAPGVREVADLGQILTWKDINIPQELLTNDEILQSHEAFKNIYGRNPQIRIALSAIKAAAETEGLRRGHCVLWGHAGCGKTSILLAIEKMLGEGSTLRLDATSTTKAGLEKMFFYDLKQVPPIVVMEEIEKCPVDPLTLWLGALDDRGEIRKVNFRGTWIKEIRIIFLCTVNNKTLFDRMMGSDGREKGALSSRCVNQIYFPRPDEVIMRRILERDILANGGNLEWINPVMDLAHKLEEDDPRKVLSFLAGGDRLLDGSYQKDRIKVWRQEEADKTASYIDRQIEQMEQKLENVDTHTDTNTLLPR